MYKRKWLTPQTISEINYITILTDCSTDQDFTKNLLPAYFNHIILKLDEPEIKNNKNERKGVIEPLFNKLIKILGEVYGPCERRIAE